MMTSIEGVVLVLILFNTSTALIVSLLIVGVLLHIFANERNERRRVAKLLEDAECVCEKLDKLYSAIY